MCIESDKQTGFVVCVLSPTRKFVLLFVYRGWYKYWFCCLCIEADINTSFVVCVSRPTRRLVLLCVDPGTGGRKKLFISSFYTHLFRTPVGPGRHKDNFRISLSVRAQNELLIWTDTNCSVLSRRLWSAVALTFNFIWIFPNSSLIVIKWLKLPYFFLKLWTQNNILQFALQAHRSHICTWHYWCKKVP